MEDNPFPGLKIANFGFLNSLETRQKCLLCGKSRMFYCYSCFTALSSLSGQLPRVKMPFKIHIIKHPGEVCGKSTAVHAAVLAPDDVTIFTYPNIPEYQDDIKVVLVYPGNNSVTLSDYLDSLKNPNNQNLFQYKSKKSSSMDGRTKDQVHSESSHLETSEIKNIDLRTTCSVHHSQTKTPFSSTLLAEYGNITDQTLESDKQRSQQNRHMADQIQAPCSQAMLGEIGLELSDSHNKEQLLGNGAEDKESDYFGLIDVVVFIDSTWFQVHKISSDPRLSNLQCIELTTHNTKFWRPQLDKPSTYLSTIEAIYYCAKEYHELCSLVPYNGQYDNLLFFFCFFYQKIKTLASKTGKRLKAYDQQRRQKPKAN